MSVFLFTKDQSFCELSLFIFFLFRALKMDVPEYLPAWHSAVIRITRWLTHQRSLYFLMITDYKINTVDLRQISIMWRSSKLILIYSQVNSDNTCLSPPCQVALTILNLIKINPLTPNHDSCFLICFLSRSNHCYRERSVCLNIKNC